MIYLRIYLKQLKTMVTRISTGVEWNSEIRLIFVNLRKITFYLGGKIALIYVILRKKKVKHRKDDFSTNHCL